MQGTKREGASAPFRKANRLPYHRSTLSHPFFPCISTLLGNVAHVNIHDLEWLLDRCRFGLLSLTNFNLPFSFFSSTVSFVISLCSLSLRVCSNNLSWSFSLIQRLMRIKLESRYQIHQNQYDIVKLTKLAQGRYSHRPIPTADRTHPVYPGLDTSDAP